MLQKRTAAQVKETASATYSSSKIKTTSVLVSTASHWNPDHPFTFKSVHHVRPQATHSPELDAPLRYGQGSCKEDYGGCFPNADPEYVDFERFMCADSRFRLASRLRRAATARMWN